MVEFNLAQAHPQYQELIESQIKGLLAKYPFIKLKSVSVVPPRHKNDMSMGNADTKDEIKLNAFWFANDPELLQKAALKDIFVDIGGKKIAWHGKLIKEPDHVIVHEFGHVFTMQVPQWKEWATAKWSEATKDPELAPSGYALSDVDEFFAEYFALVNLGLADEEQEKEFEEEFGH